MTEATQRYVERADRADPCPARHPDRFDPTPLESPSRPADEHIPGRFPFALYLDRLNRLARAARPHTLPAASVRERENTQPPEHPTPQPTSTVAPSLATPSVVPLAPATPPPPRTPPLRLIATRRGSILDVLA